MKTRKPLKRRKSLSTKDFVYRDMPKAYVVSTLKRSTRLPSRNAARAKTLRVRNFSGPFRVPHDAWIRSWPCVVPVRACDSMGSVTHAAHVRSRGAGGTYRDLVPLCHEHHAEQHRIGIKSFEAKYGLDLTAEAARLVREHEEEESR